MKTIPTDTRGALVVPKQETRNSRPKFNELSYRELLVMNFSLLMLGEKSENFIITPNVFKSAS